MSPAHPKKRQKARRTPPPASSRAASAPKLAPSKPAAPSRYEHVLASRELFWHNVMREMLTALSVHSMNREQPDSARLFDGRLAILMRDGSRVEIGAVHPLFACGVPGSPEAKALSIDLECTVFQVQTPAGEVFTLPLHEIRGFHALTQELAEELQRAAGGGAAGVDADTPFGFAAFRSTASNSTRASGQDAAI